MKKALLCLFLMFGLVGCETTEQKSNSNASVIVDQVSTDPLVTWKLLENGCMLDAANYQAALICKENIYPTLWRRVVLFEFQIDGQIYGHAMCVYETTAHAVWVWDRNGSYRVRGDKNNAYAAAMAVIPANMVVWAAWDDEY